MRHDGSAYRSTTAQIIAAEDRGFDAGRDVGIGEGIRLAIAGLEANGFTDAAAWLRKAKIVQADEEGKPQ